MFTSNSATTKVCLDCNDTLPAEEATRDHHNCTELNTYTLQAMTQDSLQAVPIEAIDDTDATIQAIDQIMGRAMTSPTWAIGHITLTSQDGRLVREMLAKRGKGDQYDVDKGLPVFSKAFSAMSGL